uniref:Ig-like domain-containing protein n=1 Tax=Denticeps clupeoides TaxID=299321 RepID=A0AAY4ACQ4_9TELE
EDSSGNTNIRVNVFELLTPAEPKGRLVSGSDVILSCKSSTTASNLLWYRQHPRSAPQFLVMVYSPDNAKKSEVVSHLLAKMSKGRTETSLQISSAAVSDSALYYCALQPTVTGNTDRLCKNLTGLMPTNTNSGAAPGYNLATQRVQS